jgi:hypothetical protein
LADPSGQGEEGRRPGEAEIAVALGSVEAEEGRKKGRGRRRTDKRGRHVNERKEKRKGWRGVGCCGGGVSRLLGRRAER